MAVAVQRTRRRQQREETRRQILETAEAFLREHPFRELSVDALMARTGHTRTVFYRHFDDVPALILALMAELGGEMVEVAEGWAASGPIGPDQARQRLAWFVDFHVRNGPLVHAVVQASHHDELVERAYTGLVERFIAITTAAIETRVESGELAPLDAAQTARALILMLNSYLQDVLGPEPKADAERVLDAVWTIWTRTLFPRG